MNLHHIDIAENLHPDIVDDYFFKRHASYKNNAFHKNEQTTYDFTCYSDLIEVDEVMVLASDERECIGGITITASDQGYPLLPMEFKGFRLQDVYPEMDLETNRYAEINNIYINPHQKSLQYNNKILFDLFHFAFQQIYTMDDIRYVFISGMKARLHLYQLMIERLDLEPSKEIINKSHWTHRLENMVLAVELPKLNLLPDVHEVQQMILGLQN